MTDLSRELQDESERGGNTPERAALSWSWDQFKLNGVVKRFTIKAAKSTALSGPAAQPEHLECGTPPQPPDRSCSSQGLC